MEFLISLSFCLAVSVFLFPCYVVKVFKGVSARRLLLEFPHLERSTGRGTLWAPSYFITTAGNVSAETIRRYIEEQRQKGG